ncbi:MAG: hypothetical protein CMB80_20905 [Flammeovirgaceae bacterium]|nr:hypothetical protein [Flammeovirgaceae bacterium]MBE62996.1 hypothetical protein [Flammeovirgaceae bacterium]MBR07068.1 hypothetical protein [Rickettsiales bacterium]|tara:strand:- start:95 stop:2248 length:2154 start_codon:yes stop_codon:yes gene_type:complete
MRIFVTCFLFLLFSSVFAGELKIYTLDGLQGVEDAEGKVVVPAIYEKLGWSNGTNDIINKTIGFYENGNWGLINIRTRKVGNAGFRILEPFNDYLIEAGKVTPYSNVVKRGLIDEKGEVIIGFNYYTIDELFPGVYKVSEYSERDLYFGVVNSEKVLIPVKHENITVEGNYMVSGSKGLTKRVYKTDGTLLVDEWVDNFRFVHDGYLISKEGYFGKLDQNGGWLHPIKHKSINDQGVMEFPKWKVASLDDLKLEGETLDIFCDSVSLDPKHDILIAHVNNAEHILAASNLLFNDQNNSLKSIRNGFLVTKNNKLQKWGIYKTDGREVATGFDSVAVDSLYFFTKTKGDWDVYNMFGRKINERPFQSIGFASNRNVPAMRNDYWGWLDFRGNVLLNYTFDKVERSFSPNHFLAKNYGSWGVSNFTGDWLVLAEYDSIYCYDHYYIGQKGAASYVIDEEGEILQSLPFEIIPTDYLKLANDQYIGAITSLGYYVHPQYEDIQLHGNYYSLKDSLFVTLIQSNGRVIVKPEDEIQEVFGYSEGYFHVLKDGKHGFIDENGKLRVANRYDEALPYNEGLAPIKLLGRWGFIDKAEILKIQPFYKYSSTFLNGLAIIQTNDGFGIITPAGKEVVEVRWKNIERLSTGNYRIVDWDEKVGLCDINGRFIVRPNYESIEDTENELLIVSKNGLKGILDYQGFTKLPLEYSELKIKGEYLILQKD